MIHVLSMGDCLGPLTIEEATHDADSDKFIEGKRHSFGGMSLF